MLEFNPDIDEDEQLQVQQVDDVLDSEEEKMKQLLASKFNLFRNLIFAVIEHPDVECKISVEQARRITAYAHQTFFRHLRLYDYVLKNTKFCEMKKVTLQKPEPKSGDPLGKAMLLEVVNFDTEEELSPRSAVLQGDSNPPSDTKESKHETLMGTEGEK